ncbi:hypothetical protein ACS0TY_011310 [Phlomoides rotata]
MHLNVPEEKIPKIGMEFEFETDAYNFYNEYSKAAGFGIRKHSAHKDKNRIVLDRIFCCECQGHRPNDKRDELIKSHRPKTRTGCEAMIKINGRYGSKYKVVNEDGQTSDVVMIKGWKRKEKKPIRSGKGKRSSLEKSQEKKKVRKANTSIENNVQYI